MAVDSWMSFVDSHLDAKQLVLFASCTALILWLGWFLSPDSEKAVDYCVPIPEQCSPDWKAATKVIKKEYAKFVKVNFWPTSN
jgi:hypothetical protein